MPQVMGMSTRKGTAKFLDDILSDVGDFMHGVMRRNEEKYSQVDNPARTAEILGISAIMVQDMSGKLCSIFRKVNFTAEEMLKADFSLLSDSSNAIDLLRAMAQFPDMVNQALKTLEPTTILTFLFKLTHKLSSSYDHLRVVDPPEGPAVSLARAVLYYGVRHVLRNGMTPVGITPIDRM
ncbi:hypothetical protein ACHAPT_009755 [Fusarium lateritium]